MSHEEPAFTVVMAAHDSAPTIRAAIASVQLQRRSDWELIVVDDGSADETLEIVAGVDDPRIRFVAQENRGPASARNAGISRARAPLISMLDSDDMWLPGYLEAAGRLLEADDTVAAVYTDAWVLDGLTGRVRRTTEMRHQRPPENPPSDPSVFFSELLTRNFVYNSVTLRRTVLDRVGGYDERLWTGEDWELWLRIAAGGFRFARTSTPLGVHRDHPGTLSTDADRMRRGDIEIYRVVAEDWGVADDVCRRARALAEGRAHGDGGVFRRAARRVYTPAKRAAHHRFGWHRSPPPEVADLLRRVSADVPAR